MGKLFTLPLNSLLKISGEPQGEIKKAPKGLPFLIFKHFTPHLKIPSKKKKKRRERKEERKEKRGVFPPPIFWEDFEKSH